jgi:hypothetical protein
MGFTRRGNGKGRTRNGNDITDNGGKTWQWVMRGGRNRKDRTRNENLFEAICVF